ncbi:MAG: nitrite/sulfite reductase [Pseudomonadales bacterium]|nr:nitrite/sulfite reductase [Pseudomonadales bacterium]
MYIYDEYDQQLVDERVAQFRDQMRRYLQGSLSEDAFRPLRLQNGLYIQRYAPMLRIAIPYGQLRTQQLRKLAEITRVYDRGYGHFSTRQNMQLNWPRLEDVPDILAELASVHMHAIQTSGNCIRNTTSDPFAGRVAGEVADPRPWCEIIRQWSTFHPEFAFLPRKFKIAVNAHSTDDRAAITVHDIGLQMARHADGSLRFHVLVGGGLGRTPILGSYIKHDLEAHHLLSYLEAILRVYNLYGRRDNKFKARIKILVRALGVEAFTELVETAWTDLKDGPLTLTDAEIHRVHAHFPLPAYDSQAPELDISTSSHMPEFVTWYRHNTHAHRQPGYRLVSLSLKRTGIPPGDVTAEQMLAIANLADRYSGGELRSTHEQNLVLADVKQIDLIPLWRSLQALGLATANIGCITDIICCPGGDFCSLANAKSIPIAEQIQRRIDELDCLYDLGPLTLNISGCMNACGHHHVGNIGILGVDKKGAEFYQVSLGGQATQDASLGEILGPSFDAADMADIIEEVVQVYLDHRQAGETFLQAYRRLGIELFKERVYATAD